MNSIEDNKDVLHTILVNELRNVYSIKYHKDAAKSKKPSVSRVANIRINKKYKLQFLHSFLFFN